MSYKNWILILAALFFVNTMSFAQDNKQIVRIARIQIDTMYLDAYRAAVKEQIEAAVKTEPGVIALQAVYEKNHPTRVTVFEVYADTEAYKKHLETPHFKKYKTGTLHMVRSLELIDVVPISAATKKQYGRL